MLSFIRSKCTYLFEQGAKPFTTRAHSDGISAMAGNGLVGEHIKASEANFGNMVRANNLLVDKTLFIEDFLGKR